MNKKLLLALPCTLVLFHGAPTVTAQDECEPMDVPPECQNAPQISINTNSKNISPRNICVEPGQEIPVQVTPSGESVTLEGKSGGWPNASGPDILLIAPDDLGEYNYNVRFEDDVCIDPRLTVR